MDRRPAIDQLRLDSALVVDLATSDNLAKRVPSCPDWDFEALANHLAMVYNWAGTIVEKRLGGAPSREDQPQRPADEGIHDWLASRATRIVSVLEEIPDEAEVWNFIRNEIGSPSFWWRRQMHETMIHRVDAELAAGREITPVAADLAADNINELLAMLRFEEVGEAADFTPKIHLHATDAGEAGAKAEWTLDTERKLVTTEHVKAETAIRGTAFDLARWLWGRADLTNPELAADLDVIGDREAATAWRHSAHF
jgi:uncharacterized protein (TIGR03083 family)